MPRGLNAAQKTALAARRKMPLYFVKLDFASGTVRAWNGVGDLVTLGATWKGLGEFGIIRGLETDRGLRASSISLMLAGVPGDYITPGIVQSTRSERYQGRPVTVYFGLANPDTGGLLTTSSAPEFDEYGDMIVGPLATVVDPVPIWTGVADVLTLTLGSSITAELTCENFASHMRRANGLRMTTESHNLRLGSPSPKDLFFDPQNRLMGAPRPLLEQ